MPYVYLGLLISALTLVAYGYLFWYVAVRKRCGTALTATRRHNRPQEVWLTCLYWLSPILFIALWGIVSFTSLLPSYAIPTPLDVALSFEKLLVSGVLIPEVFASVTRIIVGFVLATAVGVPIGLLAGAFVLGRQLINPINSFMRYIPPTAFIALMIVYFGVGEGFKYAVVFLGVIFFIVQMVIDVVDDIDPRYVEIALTSGSSSAEVFRRVILPYSLPRVLGVLRINLGAAWTFLVAAELVGAETGLGHLIAEAQRFLRMGDLYAGILTFGFIGLVTDFTLERLSRKLFPWYYISLKR